MKKCLKNYVGLDTCCRNGKSPKVSKVGELITHEFSCVEYQFGFAAKRGQGRAHTVQCICGGAVVKLLHACRKSEAEKPKKAESCKKRPVLVPIAEFSKGYSRKNQESRILREHLFC